MFRNNPNPKTLAIVNWDGILMPRSASPRQLLMALLSFAQLYSYSNHWQAWISLLPQWMQSRARASVALIYLPQVIALYNSSDMTKLIQQFKQGKISEMTFFQTLLDRHFPFLNDTMNLPEYPIDLIRKAWCYPRLQAMSELERKRLEHLLENFEKVLFVANSNATDIADFISNLVNHLAIQQQFPKAQKVLAQLSQYTATPGKNPLSTIFALSHQCGILTSAQTGTFKVVGNPRQMPEGFLARVLTAYNKSNISVISNVPSDLIAARSLAPNCHTYNSRQYYQDRSRLQNIRDQMSDNSPLIALFIIVIALLYFSLVSF